MKRILGILLIFTFGSFCVCAQGQKSKAEKKKFVDTNTGFELTYPDSVTPVVMKNNEDIKTQVGPFTLEIYKEKEAPFKKEGKTVYVAMDAIADDCYQFVKEHKNKHKVDLKEFLCTEGAAGTIYYSYIYQIEKGHYTVLLKFVHRHCNACVDAEGKPIAFNETKDLHWVKDIVESAQFIKNRK
jgi:hypothetical protein